MANRQQEPAADSRIPELAADVEELQPAEAAQVNGGIIAVLIGLAVPPPPVKSSLGNNTL